MAHTQAFKIEPFKHPIAMDPNYAGVCDWLQTTLAAIMHSCSAMPVSHSRCPLACLLCRADVIPFSVCADKTWRILESAIREIHNQNASGLSFEELYRCVYRPARGGGAAVVILVEVLSQQLLGVMTGWSTG